MPIKLREAPIGVYDVGAGYEEIAKVLGEIHHEAVPGLEEGNRYSKGALRDAVLNIVNDAVPDALIRCRMANAAAPTLLLSNGLSFERRCAVAKIVDGLLDTPIDPDDLNGWLRHFADQRTVVNARILVVDDDDMAAEFCVAALRKDGMGAVKAKNPHEALRYLETQQVDLIITDLRMPDVDGITLAQVIRQSRKYLTMPMLFFSSEMNAVTQLEARRVGGDDFITKPIDPKRLSSIVRMRLQRAHALQSLSDRDGLTGLLNHSRFIDRLGQELERCKRTGSEVSLVIVDLDKFKSVNDQYGHLTGDRVIRTLASLLVASLRKIDIVGRYGGEEFAVLLLDTPGPMALQVINRIRKNYWQTPFKAGPHDFVTSFSAGICSSRLADGIEGIIERADAALYTAKREGRNRVLLFEDQKSRKRAV